ncbi:putative choline kinase involved in LPS biosynthesis [Gynuella sunshinyii YC6258]|uniref:Putative choline kinase involved in LPS biosynthesis n=1 Tax=Gynuella sunshinyii YC6258 TaxID=1445510 RepID=A0A0C5V2I3_9GAMM|nr:putative choline kinase involved in LPS biosynthesis [Gynuella sunshinyii YC6258]
MIVNQIPAAIQAELRQWLPAVAEWRYLDAGNTSNYLFSGDDADDRYVLRVNAGDDISFGVDRKQEDQVLQLIAGHDWAPDVIRNDIDLGYCLMRYHGMPVMDVLITAPVVLQALRALQQTASGPWFDYTHLFAGYRHRLQQQPQALVELEQLQKHLQALPDDRCLIHQDLHPGNVLVADGRMVIIDWEYSGIGNAWLELANVQHHWNFSMSQLQQLPVCRQYPAKMVDQHLQQAEICNQILARLWYLARE